MKETLVSDQIIFLIDKVVQKEFSVRQGGNKFLENALHNGQIQKR